MNQAPSQETEPAGSEFTYVIDAEDRIVGVSPSWKGFAVHNNAHGLAEGVEGTPLLDHISEPATKRIYGKAIEKVRRTGRDLTLPFRCDGPHVRRFMELRITAEGDGRLRFRSRLGRSELRPPVALLDAAAPRSRDDLVSVCSWCKRVQAGEEWLEAEDAVVRLGLEGADHLPEVSHGICPACREAMTRRVKNS